MPHPYQVYQAYRAQEGERKCCQKSGNKSGSEAFGSSPKPHFGNTSTGTRVEHKGHSCSHVLKRWEGLKSPPPSYVATLSPPCVAQPYLVYQVHAALLLWAGADWRRHLRWAHTCLRFEPQPGRSECR